MSRPLCWPPGLHLARSVSFSDFSVHPLVGMMYHDIPPWSGPTCRISFPGIGEGTSHPMLNKMLKDKVPMKTYCFADEESFVPDHFAYVLEHVPDLQEAQSYMEKRGIKKGLDRMAFHMFNSIIPLKTYNCQKLFTKAPSESGHVT